MQLNVFAEGRRVQNDRFLFPFRISRKEAPAVFLPLRKQPIDPRQPAVDQLVLRLVERLLIEWVPCLASGDDIIIVFMHLHQMCHLRAAAGRLAQGLIAGLFDLAKRVPHLDYRQCFFMM